MTNKLTYQHRKLCSWQNRKDCDPSGVDILFGLPSGGVASLNPRLMARTPPGFLKAPATTCV